MTTIPERIINPWFYNNLKNTLNLNDDYKVLLNIPYKFKKTDEEYIIPDNIKELEKDNLIINRLDEDYGPITKLFGALLNNNIPDNSALLICDDDIHYKIDFVNYLYKEYVKDDTKIYSSCHDEIQGFKGYMVKKSIIKPILSVNRPQSCFTVDDDFISEWVRQNQIDIRVVSYYKDNSWKCSLNIELTDTHPDWEELNKGNKSQMQQKCLYDMKNNEL